MAACFFFLMVVGLKLVICAEAEVSKSSLTYHSNSPDFLDPSPPENDPESFRPTTDKSLFQKWVKKRRKKFSSIKNIDEISHSNQLNIFSPFGNKVAKRKKVRNHEFIRSKRFNFNNAQHQRGGSRKSFSIIQAPEIKMFMNDYVNGQESLQNTMPSEFYNDHSSYPPKITLQSHPSYSHESPVTLDSSKREHDNLQRPHSPFSIGSSFLPGIPSGIHNNPHHLFDSLHGLSVTPETPRRQHDDSEDSVLSFSLGSSVTTGPQNENPQHSQSSFSVGSSIAPESPRRPPEDPQQSPLPIGSIFLPGLPSGIHDNAPHLFHPLHGSFVIPEPPRRQHDDSEESSMTSGLPRKPYKNPYYPHPPFSVGAPVALEQPRSSNEDPQLPYPLFTVGTSIPMEPSSMPSLNPPIDDSLAIMPSSSTDHKILDSNDFRENPTQTTKHTSGYIDLFPKFTFPSQSQIPDSYSITFGNVTEKPKTFLVFDRNRTNQVSEKNSFQTSGSENTKEQNKFWSTHDFANSRDNFGSFLRQQPHNNFHSEPTNGISFITKNSQRNSLSSSDVNHFRVQTGNDPQSDFVTEIINNFSSLEPIQLQNSLFPEQIDNIYPNFKNQPENVLTIPSVTLDWPITNHLNEKLQVTSTSNFDKSDQINFQNPTLTNEHLNSLQFFNSQSLDSTLPKQNNNKPVLDENINNFFSHDAINQQINIPTDTGKVFNEHPDEVHSVALNVFDDPHEPRSLPVKTESTVSTQIDFLNLPSGETFQDNFHNNPITSFDQKRIRNNISVILKNESPNNQIFITDLSKKPDFNNHFYNFPEFTTESATKESKGKKPLSTSFKIIKLNSISLNSEKMNIPDTQIKPTVDEACLIPGQWDCKEPEDEADATNSYPILTGILEYGGSEISNLLNGNLIRKPIGNSRTSEVHEFSPPTVNPQLAPDLPHLRKFPTIQESSLYRLTDGEVPVTRLNAISMPPNGKLVEESSNLTPPKFSYFESSGSNDFTTSPSSSYTSYSPTSLLDKLSLKKVPPHLPPLLHLTPFEPRPPPPTPPQIPKRIPIHPPHKFTLVTPIKYMSSTTEQISTSLEPPEEDYQFPFIKDNSYLEVNDKDIFPTNIINRKPRRPLQNLPTPPPSYFPNFHHVPKQETASQFDKIPLRIVSPFLTSSSSASENTSHFKVFSNPTTTTTPTPEVSVVFDPKQSVRNAPMVIFTPPRPVFPPPPPFIDNKGHEQDPGPLISELSQQGHRSFSSNLKSIENSKEELPKKYEYRYIVKDPAKGIQYGHAETREGPRAQGEYFVTLPDGRTQLVKYILDENGYRADVKYYENSLPVSK